ncbi:MAG: hypothetical protein AAF993_12570 [Pseudomonadota bacterium]
MSLEIELPDLPDAPEADVDDGYIPELRSALKKNVQLFADTWFKTPLRVAVTGVVVLGCLGLIGWNLQRLAVLDQLVAAEVAEFQLEDQLSDLQIALTRIDMPALKDALEAENEKVFQGFPELAAWAEGLSVVAERRDMQFSYRVEPAHAASVPGLLEVPVWLEFKASGQRADSLFIDAMDLIGVVLSDHWHIEVVSTHGKGGGQQLDELSLRAQVWVRDRFGFVSAAEIAGQEVAPADVTDPFGF